MFSLAVSVRRLLNAAFDNFGSKTLASRNSFSKAAASSFFSALFLLFVST
jgi:hypothetical protein